MAVSPPASLIFYVLRFTFHFGRSIARFNASTLQRFNVPTPTKVLATPQARARSPAMNLSTLADRRSFLKTTAVVGASFAAGLGALAQAGANRPDKRNIKLGLDNFAVRAMGWKAPELIEYAVRLKTDSLLISDLDALGSLEEKPLGELKAMASDKGLQIHLGTWSICPTSKT